MILVTGGAGYIGSHFVYRAIRRDATREIVVIDDLTEGHETSIADFDRVHLEKGNIGDPSFVRDVLAKYPIESAVHFAANAYVGESQSNPFKYFRNNVTNSIALLEMMNEFGVKKIVFSSSCATYGLPVYSPLDESHPQNPINTYGMTKLMVEQVLHRLAETSGWSYVSLRYFNAAGAETEASIGESHNPETHLLPRVLQAAKGTLNSLEILGNDYPTRDGTCIRDYIHVNDLADAHLASLDILGKKEKVAEAINLGTASGYSVLEVVERCREICGREIRVTNSPRRPGDPPELVADASKARQILAWTPNYSLDDIIQSAWLWELNRRF